MIQARPRDNGEAFGSFRLMPNDQKSKLFGCPDNTILVRILMYHEWKILWLDFVEHCFS